MGARREAGKGCPGALGRFGLDARRRGRHHREMLRLGPSAVSLVLLMFAPGACRGGDTPASSAPPGADTGSVTPPSGRHAPAPRLSDLRFGDMTPPDVRPAGVPERGAELVSAAFFADDAFTRAPDGEVGACTGEVVLGYGLVRNGRPVIDADAGEARAVVNAEVRCPGEGKDEDTYRIELAEVQPFGGVDAAPWRERLEAAIATVARRAARALNGQIRMRHATDAEVLDALAHDEHAGILIEAASEAGERGLKAAVDDLARLTADDEPLVTLRAGAALGLLGDGREEVVRALVKMTDGPNEERHLVAIHALGDIGGEVALRYLDNLATGHPNVALREIAREAAKQARAKLAGGRDGGP